MDWYEYGEGEIINDFFKQEYGTLYFDIRDKYSDIRSFRNVPIFDVSYHLEFKSTVAAAEVRNHYIYWILYGDNLFDETEGHLDNEYNFTEMKLKQWDNVTLEKLKRREWPWYKRLWHWILDK